MSFPRARIQRFNENKTDAPSPTRYDPKLGEKAKGCVIGKERERSSSTSDAPSTSSTPFRTPYSVVKKHSCVASSEKTIVPRIMTFGDNGVATQQLGSSEDAVLREELAKKTQDVSDFQKLVEELNEQISNSEKNKVHLEQKIAVLEVAKAELECMVSNNRNCEIQIQELTEKLGVLENQLANLRQEKDDILKKWDEEEKRMVRLEDASVEYEKKIISLEGTLDQVTLEYNEKVQEVRQLHETGEQLKISIEHLQGKIAFLENQVRTLEVVKSKNEETIFGLEEKASLLTFSLDAVRAEAQSHQEDLIRLAVELDQRKEACKLYEETITGLDMQLEAKQKEIQKLNIETRDRISTLDAEIASVTAQLEEVEAKGEARSQEMSNLLLDKEHGLQKLGVEKDALLKQNEELSRLQKEKELLIEDLTQQLSNGQKEIKALEEERKRIVSLHEEEVFHLQQEWEKKILVQIQESEQALMEKDAVMKLADLKHTKMLKEAREEWEGLLRQAEEEASRRQSAQLEAGEMMKAKFEARIADLEASIAQVLECKAREAALQAERYKEVCNELEAQVQLLKEKEQEISTLSSCNHKMSSRVNNLLEEVKILNAETSQKQKELEDMTSKFKNEWKKNEKLSEQLGELDSKIATFSEELKAKANEKDRLSNELKKFKDECNALRLKNLDMELNVVTYQDTANNLSAELEASRNDFNSQLMQLSAELSHVKRQCRKFEIAMTDTRKSLEALGVRLLESENEVERLNQENEMMRSVLATAENDKNEAENKYRQLMDVKIDLEQRVQTAEVAENMLREKVKELELKNCELELSINEVQIMKDTLEGDKKNYEAALVALKDVVNEQNIKMVQLERESLDQIEQVSQSLISKLEEFERFSTEKIQKLNAEIHRLEKEKDDIVANYKAKAEEYDNLFTDHDILKTTFDIATKESQSLKKHYEEQRIELDNTIVKMTQLEAEKSSLADQLETANMASTNLAKELEEKLTLVENLTDTKKAQEVTITGLQSENDLKQKTLNSLATELTQLRNDFEEKLKTLRSTKDKEIDLLQKEQKEYQAKLLKNTDEVVALLLNLENERKNSELLEETNKKLLQTVQDLEKSVYNLNASLENSEATKAEMLVQLKKVKEEMEGVKIEKLAGDKKHEEELANLHLEVKKAQEGGDWKVKWEKLLEEKEALNSELLAMTDKKDSYKYHCQQFEAKLITANKDCEQAIKDFNAIHNVLQDKEAETTEMQKRIADLESLIGPFREQLEQYESERMMLENDREQLRRQHLEQASKLGHQNHKQKIQHVVKLKADILQLREENQKLQFEVKSKNKVIEHLREEIGEHPKRLFINGKRPTSTPFKGKENDERMSPIPSIKQEPMSPSTNALKDRNY